MGKLRSELVNRINNLFSYPGVDKEVDEAVEWARNLNKPMKVKGTHTGRLPKPVVWITSAGDITPVTDMETSHLFYTLRLIWNSMMPRPLSVGTYKATWFSQKVYTHEYWAKFLPAAYKELQSRSNLADRYQEQLADMQLHHLLAITTDKAALTKAIEDYNEREDDYYAPEYNGSTWEDEPG